jgi:hypothetical protein
VQSTYFSRWWIRSKPNIYFSPHRVVVRIDYLGVRLRRSCTPYFIKNSSCGILVKKRMKPW